MERFIRAVLICSCCGLIGCGSDSSVAPVPPRALQIVNDLGTQITVSVDGTAFGGVSAGRSTTLTVPGNAKTVSYTLLPFRYGDGSNVPNDFTGESLSLPSGAQQLTVTNIADGQPYIYFTVFNTSGATIDFAVVQTGQVRCLGSLQNSTSQSYGYYRFSSTTEARIYRAGSNCTGLYLYWPNQVISAYDPNSGARSLGASIAP